MGEATTSVKDSREKIAELRKRHEVMFEKLGIADALFIPKLAHRPKTEAGVILEELHVAFFVSELQKAKDVYIEFAGAPEYKPQDPERKLYKWRYNPHWSTEYARTEEHPVSGYRYLVPVSELIEVKEGKTGEKLRTTAEAVSTEFKIDDPDTDSPLQGATLRDLYAVLHNKPGVTLKPWLDKIIRNNQPK